MAFYNDFLAKRRCAAHKNPVPAALGSNRAFAGVPGRADDLTAFRAVLATWVFLYHARLELSPGAFTFADGLIRRGYLGVDGFFILSGLILAYAHSDLPISPRSAARFWVRRLLRIYPLHLATLGLLALMLTGAAITGVPPRDPGRFGLTELARHLFLLHGWGFSDRWAWNYPSWSISTEWAGYLLFPLLCCGLRRLPAASCLGLVGAMLALLALIEHQAGLVGLNLTFHGALFRFFPEFIAGMAGARLVAQDWTATNGRTAALIGAALSIACLAFAADWLVVAGLWITLLGLLLGARQGRAPLLARLPCLTWLGGVSYAFYMSFALVETIQAFAWRRLAVAPAERPWLYLALSTGLTLGLAVAGWWWIERPALRLGRHLAGGAPGG